MISPVIVRFQIKKHSNRPYLRMQIKDSNGNPYDLTSATSAYFFMGNGSTIKTSSPAIIESPETNGILRYEWTSLDTDTSGEFFGEFEVFFGAEKLTVPNNGSIGITIYSDIDDN